MEELFSSNSKDIIQKQLNVCVQGNNSLKTIEELDFYFDIQKLTKWISENNYKRVIIFLNF